MTYDRLPNRDKTKKRIESPAMVISQDETLEKHAKDMATFAGFFARILYDLWNSRTAQD